MTSQLQQSLMHEMKAYLGSLLLTAMDLNVLELALLVHPLERVARISVLEPVAIRKSTVSEEDHHLMNTLRVLA